MPVAESGPTSIQIITEKNSDDSESEDEGNKKVAVCIAHLFSYCAFLPAICRMLMKLKAHSL